MCCCTSHSWDDEQLPCSSTGQIWDDEQLSCSTGQIWDNEQLSCSTGQIWDDEQLVYESICNFSSGYLIYGDNGDRREDYNSKRHN